MRKGAVLLIAGLGGCSPSPQAPAPQAAGVEKAGQVADGKAGEAVPEPKGEKPAYTPFGKPAVVGHVGVKVFGAGIGLVPLETARGQGLSEEDALVVRMRISNESDSKLADYTTWRQDSPGGDAVELIDDLGNKYKRIVYTGMSITGSVLKPVTIYPGKSEVDIVPFQVPVEKAQRLFLHLPGKRAGVEGTFRVEIPRSEWAKK